MQCNTTILGKQNKNYTLKQYLPLRVVRVGTVKVLWKYFKDGKVYTSIVIINHLKKNMIGKKVHLASLETLHNTESIVIKMLLQTLGLFITTKDLLYYCIQLDTKQKKSHFL